MSVTHIESDEELNKVIQQSAGNNITVFIKFGAQWCGPCKAIAPYYAQLAAAVPQAIFLSVDIDEVEDAATKFNVSSLPTFIVLKNGQYVADTKGANPNALKDLVQTHTS